MRVLPVLVGRKSSHGLNKFNFQDYGGHSFPKVNAAEIRGTVQEVVIGMLEHQAAFLVDYPTSPAAPIICSVAGNFGRTHRSSTTKRSDLDSPDTSKETKVPLPVVIATLVQDAWVDLDGDKHWVGSPDPADDAGADVDETASSLATSRSNGKVHKPPGGWSASTSSSNVQLMNDAAEEPLFGFVDLENAATTDQGTAAARGGDASTIGSSLGPRSIRTSSSLGLPGAVDFSVDVDSDDGVSTSANTDGYLAISSAEVASSSPTDFEFPGVKRRP